MDYFDRIQKSVDYIELYITEELNLETVAKEAYCSLFHFHRVFQAVVGDTVKEYIRKRRLSLAGRELAASNAKVLDVALKYGYESPEAFTKAFKKFHNSTPHMCRKSGTYNFREKAYVHIYKINLFEGGSFVNYRIIEKEEFKVIGYEIRVRCDNGDNFKLIPEFWRKYMEDGLYKKIAAMPNVVNKENMVTMGMCMDFDGINSMSYLICVEASSFDAIPEGMAAKTIPAQKYAIFTAKGKMPDAIQQTWKDIYEKWFPASGYERTDGPDFECYDKRSEKNDENTEVDIYVPIK